MGYNEWHLSMCYTREETPEFLWNFGCSIDSDLDLVPRFPGLVALWSEASKKTEDKIWIRRQLGQLPPSKMDKVATTAVTAGVYTAGAIVMTPFVVVMAGAFIAFVAGFWWVVAAALL